MTKYQRLKIAAAILGVSIKDLCSEADISMTGLKGVADGHITSERVSSFIDAKIEESEKIFQQQKQSA